MLAWKKKTCKDITKDSRFLRVTVPNADMSTKEKLQFYYAESSNYINLLFATQINNTSDISHWIRTSCYVKIATDSRAAIQNIMIS